MKILDCLRWLLPALMAGFVTSCDTMPPRPVTDTGRRFHDVAAVNVAFQFFRWDSIYMLRPDTRENGFFPIYTRDDIAGQIDQRSASRDLAVVVLGYIFSSDLENSLMQQWATILGERGFHRVIFLRAGERMNIDGLLIVRDSAIAGVNVEPAFTTPRIAAIPSAP